MSTTTRDDAAYVFTAWHERISQRDAPGLCALYTDDAVLESPLVCRVLDQPSGIVSGRMEIDTFLTAITRTRPHENDLPSLFRTGRFLYEDGLLFWEYPRHTPGRDQLDLAEVMELDGPRIRRHRIYWGWRGTEHLIDNALTKAASD